MNALPPAGWHPDPELPQMQRYWDGNEWTDHRAPYSQAKPKGGADLVAAAYIGALLLPPIGFVIGFIAIAKDRVGHGIAAVLLSIVSGFVLWPMVFLASVFG